MATALLFTIGPAVDTTIGKKMNEIETQMRRIQPQSARPVATRAGFRASTDSV